MTAITMNFASPRLLLVAAGAVRAGRRRAGEIRLVAAAGRH